MRLVLEPLPVLYACQGCPEYGQVARDAGARMERAGTAELHWLGSRWEVRPTDRYPVFAIDGCAKACAARWLEGHGLRADRSYIVGAQGCAGRV
jgi:uncharacterized metal-binding protein